VQTLRACEFDGSHPQPLNISLVPNAAHPDPVVYLEDLLALAPQRQQEDASLVAKCDDRAAGRQLMLDVFPSVGDRLDPSVWLFDHSRSGDVLLEELGELVLLQGDNSLCRDDLHMG
jgi:hypothetical protein